MTDQEISDYIFLSAADQQGDIALVFGVDIWHDPLEKAVELYRKQAVSKLLFTGGVNRFTGENEAQCMYQGARKAQIPMEDLLLVDQAHNTLENVTLARELIDRTIGWDSIKTVCGVMANSHARRALMTMKKHFPETVQLKACPYVCKKFGITKDNWTENEQYRARVLSELERIQIYLAKGDIAEL